MQRRTCILVWLTLVLCIPLAASQAGATESLTGCHSGATAPSIGSNWNSDGSATKRP